MIGDLLDRWKVFLRCVKMVHCHLVHGNVHYRAVRAMSVVPWEVRLANRRSSTVRPAGNPAAILLLDLLIGLENWWQQTLILHERAIMMVPFRTTSGTDRPANIIFKVTIKSLMLAVFNFEVCKVAPTVLGGKRSLLHINVLLILIFLFLWVKEIATRIHLVVILIIKGAI